MHIRHTARATVTREEAQNNPKYTSLSLSSTPTGIQAAIDFGSSLPTNRKYRLYHTFVERTTETAQAVNKGILSNGGKSEMIGEIPCRIQNDPVASANWAKRQRWFPEDGAYNVTCQWIAGLRPPSILKPSIDYSREMAGIAVGNLGVASSDAFHVYVSHDNWVQALMFHWFGVLPQPGGLRFLDGFLMQLLDEGIKAWFRGGCGVYDYPYWWPK